MKVRAQLLNFTKGEVSPEVASRFDLGVYQAGARTATNVRVRRTGGLSKRMGTRIIARALSDDARLVPFQFNDEQAYALEFGQAYMRPLALGGAVLEDGLVVSAITNANPATVTVQNHGFEVGDQVYFIDIEGMVQINDRFLTILSVPDADTFTIDIDTTNFGVFAGSGTGGEVNVDPPPAPPAPPVVPPEIVEPETPHVGSGGLGGYVGGDEEGGFGGHWAGNQGPHIP